MGDYKIVYVVHSDVDENNVKAEFNNKDEAIEYAKEHAADKTWVEAVDCAINDFGEVIEVLEQATIWNSADEEKPATTVECFKKEDLEESIEGDRVLIDDLKAKDPMLASLSDETVDKIIIIYTKDMGIKKADIIPEELVSWFKESESLGNFMMDYADVLSMKAICELGAKDSKIAKAAHDIGVKCKIIDETGHDISVSYDVGEDAKILTTEELIEWLFDYGDDIEDGLKQLKDELNKSKPIKEEAQPDVDLEKIGAERKQMADAYHKPVIYGYMGSDHHGGTRYFEIDPIVCDDLQKETEKVMKQYHPSGSVLVAYPSVQEEVKVYTLPGEDVFNAFFDNEMPDCCDEIDETDACACPEYTPTFEDEVFGEPCENPFECEFKDVDYDGNVLADISAAEEKAADQTEISTDVANAGDPTESPAVNINIEVNDEVPEDTASKVVDEVTAAADKVVDDGTIVCTELTTPEDKQPEELPIEDKPDTTEVVVTAEVPTDIVKDLETDNVTVEIPENTEITEENKVLTDYVQSEMEKGKTAEEVASTEEFKDLVKAEGQKEIKEYYPSAPAIEDDSESTVKPADNAVVDCPVNPVIAHSEDEKPLDCKMEKAPLEKPLTEEEKKSSNPDDWKADLLDDEADKAAELNKVDEGIFSTKENYEDDFKYSFTKSKIADTLDNTESPFWGGIADKLYDKAATPDDVVVRIMTNVDSRLGGFKSDYLSAKNTRDKTEVEKKVLEYQKAFFNSKFYKDNENFIISDKLEIKDKFEDFLKWIEDEKKANSSSSITESADDELQFTLGSIISQSDDKEIKRIVDEGIYSNNDAILIYDFIDKQLQTDNLNKKQKKLGEYFKKNLKNYSQQGKFKEINTLFYEILDNKLTSETKAAVGWNNFTSGVKETGAKLATSAANLSSTIADSISSSIQANRQKRAEKKAAKEAEKLATAGVIESVEEDNMKETTDLEIKQEDKIDNTSDDKTKEKNDNIKDSPEYKAREKELALLKQDGKIEKERAGTIHDLEKETSKTKLQVAKDDSKVNDMEFEKARKDVLRQMMQKRADGMEQEKPHLTTSNEVVGDPTWNTKLHVDQKNMQITEAKKDEIDFSKIDSLTKEEITVCAGVAALNFTLSGIYKMSTKHEGKFSAEDKGTQQWKCLEDCIGVIKVAYPSGDVEEFKKALPQMFKEDSEGLFAKLVDSTKPNENLQNAEDVIDCAVVMLDTAENYTNVFGNTICIFKDTKKGVEVKEVELKESLQEQFLDLSWIAWPLSVVIGAAIIGVVGGLSTAVAVPIAGAGVGIGISGAIGGVYGGVKSTPEAIKNMQAAAVAFNAGNAAVVQGVGYILKFVGDALTMVGKVGSAACDIVVKAVNQVIKPSVDLAFSSYETLVKDLKPMVKHAIDNTMEIADTTATEAFNAVENITSLTWNTIKCTGADAYNACSDRVWLVKQKLDLKKQQKFKEKLHEKAPYLSLDDLDRLMDTCENKHITPSDSVKALNYLNEQVETVNEVLKMEKLTQAKKDQSQATKDLKAASDELAQTQADANTPTELKDNSKKPEKEKKSLFAKKDKKDKDDAVDVKPVEDEPERVEVIDAQENSDSDIKQIGTADQEATDVASTEDKAEIVDVDSEMKEALGDDAFSLGAAGVGAGATIGGIVGTAVGAGAAAGTATTPVIGTAIGAVSGAIAGIVVALIKYIQDKKQYEKQVKQDEYINKKLTKIERKVGKKQAKDVVEKINTNLDVDLSLEEAEESTIEQQVQLVFEDTMNRTELKKFAIESETSGELGVVEAMSEEEAMEIAYREIPAVSIAEQVNGEGDTYAIEITNEDVDLELTDEELAEAVHAAYIEKYQK